jgi:membrane protease YdiL (CAAX protease family)
VVWFLLSERLASAVGLFTRGDWYELLYRVVLLALLLAGFSMMGLLLDGQEKPLQAMGLVARATARREWATGAALGWGLVVLAVLPMALSGVLHVSFWTQPRAFYLCGINLGMVFFATLVEEVVFRGYPFQRLIEAAGPTGATVLMAIFFGCEHLSNYNATMTSVLVTMLAGVLLSVAYLRTRALWLPWGLHLAWNVSMGTFLGLPVSGNLSLSTIVQTRAEGARWLTGGDYGPEAAAATFVVLLIGIVVLRRVTVGYAWEYTHKPIVAGGYPVEVAPPKAHTLMEGKPAAGATLVQIAGSTSQEASLHGKDVLPELPRQNGAE